MKAIKPIVSAFISVKKSVGKSSKCVESHVCIDTGAKIIFCDSAFLPTHFGGNVLRHVVEMAKPPKLASSHGLVVRQRTHDRKVLGSNPC